MSPELVGAIGIIILMVLIFVRIWIGAAMLLVAILGYLYLDGPEITFVMAGQNPLSTIASYTFTAVPLFILMGTVVSNTGVGADLYNTAYKWIGKLRGGLAMSTVAACAMFAAICGSSMATSATMGKVALPEMKKYNYDEKLAAGSIAAGGTMGILIPPSMGFILYGLITEVSIGHLFMAGLIPGILEAVFYIVTIFILCRFNPSLGPRGASTSFKEKIISLKDTWAMVLLFALVMGGIYLGIFTPTEAGAIGAFGAIVISLIARRLSWQAFKISITDTAQTTAMIAFLVIGAFMLVRFLAISELPFVLGDTVAGLNLPPIGVLIAIVILYIILGCFLDIIAAIILTTPIIFPVVLAMGFDPIWFGVIMVRMMEIGAITPPMGLNVFVLSSVTDIPIGTIFRGIVPFIISDFCHVALLIAVPSLSLFIPQSM
jgi:C4-dicarboxylate transporter DctM subunit